VTQDSRAPFAGSVRSDLSDYITVGGLDEDVGVFGFFGVCCGVTSLLLTRPLKLKNTENLLATAIKF